MEQFVSFIDTVGFPICVAIVVLLFLFKMFTSIRDDSRNREELYFEQMGKFDQSITTLNSTMQDMSETMRQQSNELKSVVERIESVDDKVDVLSTKVEYLEKKA